MTDADFAVFSRTERAGLAPLSDASGAHAHSQAHAALSDHLDPRDASGESALGLRRGTQTGANWAAYLDDLEANGRGSAASVLEDLDGFYRGGLGADVRAGRYPFLVGQTQNLRRAYDIDRATIVRCS
jgi:hypothetical protein